jgi:tellurite methyltransferase
VIRQIVGFHFDEEGDWVAELSCLHNQHVRHRPPFIDRAWVLSDGGRREHLGSAIDCPLCERGEVPEGLIIQGRIAGERTGQDLGSVPKALCRDHVVPDGHWGLLRILAGALRLSFSEAGGDTELTMGQSRGIPPGVHHHIVLSGPVSFELEIRGRGTATSPSVASR